LIDIADLQKLEVSPEHQAPRDGQPAWCGPPCTYFSDYTLVNASPPASRADLILED